MNKDMTVQQPRNDSVRYLLLYYSLIINSSEHIGISDSIWSLDKLSYFEFAIFGGITTSLQFGRCYSIPLNLLSPTTPQSCGILVRHNGNWWISSKDGLGRFVANLLPIQLCIFSCRFLLQVGNKINDTSSTLLFRTVRGAFVNVPAVRVSSFPLYSGHFLELSCSTHSGYQEYRRSLHFTWFSLSIPNFLCFHHHFKAIKCMLYLKYAPPWFHCITIRHLLLRLIFFVSVGFFLI